MVEVSRRRENEEEHDGHEVGDSAEENHRPEDSSDPVEDSRSHGDKDFDLKRLKESFESCITEDGQVLLQKYVEGYEELYRFLNLLGTVFGWVSSDVDAKLQVLRDRMKTSEGGDQVGPRPEYLTVQSMVKYEVDEDMVKRKAKDCNTGTRNLLRLHRALEYIIAFLEALPGLAPLEKCCHVSQEAYKRTLIRYHPWVVQKAALLAMHMLPIKQGLVEKVCGSRDPESEEYKDIDKVQLPNGVKVMRRVYDITQQVYAEYDLLGLH